MGEESTEFRKNLVNMIAKNEAKKYTTIMPWIRTKLSFVVLKSALLCVRGTRTPYEKKDCDLSWRDFMLNSVESQVSGQ